jgi:hypothetical protein
VPSQHSELPVAFVAGKPVSYITRDRSWSNTLNYSTVPRDQLPVNTYDDSKISRFQNLGHEVITRKSDGVITSDTRIGYATTGALTTRHNELSSWLATFEPSDARLLNECAVKVLGKLADLKVSLPVTVAEAHKTSKHILDTANRVYWAYRSFRKGHFGDMAESLGISSNPHRNKFGFSASKASKSFSNHWLSYKYGWMPLLMDIKGSAEAIVDQLHGGRLPWQVVSARVTSQTSKQNHFTSAYSTGSYGDEAASAAKSYKIKIWADISSPHLNQAQQLGLTNPAAVAWELVPFSFVFDWFMSVGNYLVAATALQGVTIRRAFVSRIREVNTSYHSHAQAYETSTSRISGYDLLFSSYGRSYSRAPYSVDSAFLYPPINRDPLNFNRLVTGLALIRGNARGFRV